MVQDTNWIWLVLGSAGCLSLAGTCCLGFLYKGTARGSRLLTAMLFCFSLWGFDFCLRQGLPGYYPGTILYGAFFLLFLIGSKENKGLEENFTAGVQPDMAEQSEEKGPVNRPALSIEQSLKLRQSIGDHLSSSLAFRRPGYTIRDLANETGIPGYMISMFINQEYGMNFNELINAYRVEYLARVFNTSFDYKTYTLEALGKMAGFNSRTAFIASIKKHTGMTPSAFFGRKTGEHVIPVIFKVPEMKRDVA